MKIIDSIECLSTFLDMKLNNQLYTWFWSKTLCLGVTIRKVNHVNICFCHKIKKYTFLVRTQYLQKPLKDFENHYFFFKLHKTSVLKVGVSKILQKPLKKGCQTCKNFETMRLWWDSDSIRDYGEKLAMVKEVGGSVAVVRDHGESVTMVRDVGGSVIMVWEYGELVTMLHQWPWSETMVGQCPCSKTLGSQWQWSETMVGQWPCSETLGSQWQW